MPKHPDFDEVVITKQELAQIFAACGYEELFPRLRYLSASRGLIYHGPKKNILKDVRFRTWFDAEGNLHQQNFIVDNTSLYVNGTGPRVISARK